MAKTGIGAVLTDELKVELAKAAVPKDVITALEATMKNAFVNPYALTYAHAMSLSFDEHGIPGVKWQVLYLLQNMQSWKGEEARNSKKILNKWGASE